MTCYLQTCRSTYDELLERGRKFGHVTFLSVRSVLILGPLGIDRSYEVMKNRGGGDPGVSGFGTDSFEAILQSTNERSAGWTGVAGVHDLCGLVQIDFCDLDEIFYRLDKCRGIGGVCEGGSVTLPSVLQHLSARINELDTVILRRFSVGTRGYSLFGVMERTTSGLCEAVTMTPMVFPSSLLLLNAARTPTRKSVESRILPLQQNYMIDVLRGGVGPYTVLNPAVPYWNCIPLGFGWRSDNRRSSLTFRGIAGVAGDKDLGSESSARKWSGSSG